MEVLYLQDKETVVITNRGIRKYNGLKYEMRTQNMSKKCHAILGFDN
jgi:hypothetical protein